MSNFSSYGRLQDPWFKLGPIEVGSTMFVVLWTFVSWIAFAAAPNIVNLLGYAPQLLVAGEPWRLVSWPLANAISMWSVFNLFFFWTFGTELEQQIGRAKMAQLLVAVWAALTLACTAVGLGLHLNTTLVGIGMVQFVILLLWIAENPSRPFFFGIPAWVVGAVLVAVQLLQLIAYRALGDILELLLALVLVALAARRLGLLRSIAWLPGAPKARANRPSKVQRAQQKQAQQREQDDAKLNALLDQISEKGMDSLSPGQRRELMRLRNRR